MYAIIETGGKQHRVAEGDVIDVELLNTEGKSVTFDRVLFTHDGAQAKVGTPVVAGSSVHGDLLGRVDGEKVKGLKYKPSHNQCRTWGHRQKYTRVKITRIQF